MEPKLLKNVEIFKALSILGFKTLASWNPKRCLPNRAHKAHTSPEALDPALVETAKALQYPMAKKYGQGRRHERSH